MKANTAILVIDMLEEFIHGKLKSERALSIVPAVRRLLAGARQAGVPVIYTNDAHLPGDPEMAIWGEHAMAGTPGAQVIDELAPQDGDHQIAKRSYSAFHDTDLDELLRELDIDAVVLVGIHTHICAEHTAADAFYRGFKVVVAPDGVDAFTAQHHDGALERIVEFYGATLCTTDALLDAWNEAAA